MISTRAWVFGCGVVATVALSAGPALAGGGVQVIRANQPDRAEEEKAYQVGSDHQQHVRLITRPIVDPAATVGRDLSDQPVHRHLAEMVVVNQRVLFDPKADYYRQGGRNSIDDNHSLIRAQQLYDRLHTRGAHVIRNVAAMQKSAETNIRPRMIIIKPAAPRQRSTPNVPAPPKEQNRQMAAAE